MEPFLHRTQLLSSQQLHKIYTRSVPLAPIMKGREGHGVHPFGGFYSAHDSREKVSLIFPVV